MKHRPSSRPAETTAKTPTKTAVKAPTEPPGLGVRRVAADIVDGVLRRHRPLDEQLEGASAHPGLAGLADRDRALVRALVAVVLRRLGTLRHLLGLLLERGLPKDAPRVETALLIGAAQILFLDVPDHAAVDLAVRLVQADRNGMHFTGLVNAVLRRLTREGAARLAELDMATLDTPKWLMERWVAAYGERHGAGHSGRQCQRTGARRHGEKRSGVVGRASWRLGLTDRLGTLDRAWHGYGAARLRRGRLVGAGRRGRAAGSAPRRCRGPARRRSMCGAGRQGGAACGRRRTRHRGRSLAGAACPTGENLKRLSLTAALVCADVAEWDAAPFDAVLVDAPCSSTGTIRRHPDVPWLKQPADVEKLTGLQRRLIERAVVLTKPGGTLVYCTCSLEPDEGEAIVNGLLAHETSVQRVPVDADEVYGRAEFVTKEGDLRTLPCHLPDADPRRAGLDGFYAARLLKR